MLDEGMEFVHRSLQTDEITLDNAVSIYEILYERGVVLDTEIGTTYFAQGGLIHKIKQKDLWRQFPGVEDWWEFGHFIKNKFSMSLQKAHALAQIWRKSHGLITPSEIQELGWFTTSEILRNCTTREEVEKYLGLRRGGMEKTEILQMVRDANPNRKNRSVTRFKRRVDFEEHEALFFDECLEKAASSVGRSLGENMRREEALLMIIAQWREMRNGHGEAA